MEARGSVTGTTRNRSWLFRAAGAVAHVIWPPRSLLSDAAAPRSGLIEPELWAQLRFLGPPQCERCGFPLSHEVGPGAVCGGCAAEAPAFDRARAALAYDDHARRMVLQLKRGGRRDGLPTFASWMTLAGAELLEGADLLVPVPLHWRRLARRGFNQAAWLAQSVSRRTGLRWSPAPLQRVRSGPGQAGLTAAQRERAVQGAFRATQAVQGRRIVVIDDVFTTGATAEACARALRKAGAAQIDVLTLTRVVHPLRSSI